MRLPQSDNASESLPILTATVGVACAVIFAGILLTAPQAGMEAAMERWGYVTTEQTWKGDYRGLLTNVLVHVQVWHIAFNLYWFWTLGSIMERALGQARWLAFFIGAAVVSSGLQLATGGMGHGLSGVGYALFGFGWMARTRIDAYRYVLNDQNVKIFLIWAVGCLVATELGWVSIGNGAHFGGCLFGVLLGALYARRQKPILLVPALLVTVAASIVPLFGAPWTREWVGMKAMDAHKRRDYPTAERLYLRALKMGRNDKDNQAWAWHNLALIYAIRNDRARFDDALTHLREVNSASADELKKLVDEPGTEN